MTTKQNLKLFDHYSKLQGYTMIGCVEDGSPETFSVYGKALVGLKFKNFATGEALIVFPMSDAEGNDAGFLEINEIK